MYTEHELQQILSSIIITIDTREKNFKHIVNYFDKIGLQYQRKKLHSGDYSCIIKANTDLHIHEDIDFSEYFVIERKASLEELSNNFTWKRKQFVSEFERHKGKICVLVERGNIDKIKMHKYRTGMSPQAFIASIESFKEKHGADFIFADGNWFIIGKLIHDLICEKIKEWLNGRITTEI